METYPGHTKCITEEEKYSGKDFVPRPSANKGEKKQKKWQDVIQSVQEKQNGLSNEERTILNVLVKHENVPRKKNKFQVKYYCILLVIKYILSTLLISNLTN